MTEKLYKPLKELGLSDPEIELYIHTLMAGSVSVTTLARELDLSRPIVYKLVCALERRGLAKRDRRKKYLRQLKVESPIEVLEKIRAKRELCLALDTELLEAMPELLAMYKRDTKPSIHIFEGKSRLATLFDEVLEEKMSELLFFGSPKDFMGLFPQNIFEQRLKKRVEKKIRLKVLATEGGLVSRDDAKELREVRVLGTSPFFTTFQLVAEKLVFWQPRSLYAVVIEDGYFAEMMRATFYALWAQATPSAPAAGGTG